MADSTGPEPLPAYIRITEMLTRDIADGRLPDGARLPPERDLAPQLGVSIGTLRKALAALDMRGLLTRRHGSGNYVRFDGRAAAGYTMFRLELLSGGGQPSAKLIDVARVAKPASFAALGPAPEAFRIRRIRVLSGSPVALEDIWLDGRFGHEIDADALGQSLYRYYQQAFGLWILRAEDRIHAGQTPDWAPHDQPLMPGAPASRIDRTAWDQHGEVAEMSVTHFDPSRAAYRARIP
ncbi:MAG: GntR family transcriptional regulator [Pseudomonadota bacterium]